MARRPNRILVPTTGSLSWKPLLGDPELHWKEGRSAKLMADLWESAPDMPAELKAVLEAAGFADPELLFAAPEWVTELPDGLRGSQTDLFCLIRSDEKVLAVGMEAKVDESFGPTVGSWLDNPSPARPKRLIHLVDMTGASEPPPSLRYQLIHRTASAMIEAKRFGADAAVMLIMSFSNKKAGYVDFEAFAKWLGVDEVQPNQLMKISTQSEQSLAIGWLTGTGGDD
jgi:Domain of unknown function (DUF6946)